MDTDISSLRPARSLLHAGIIGVLFLLVAGFFQAGIAAEGEEHLLVLRNGGMVCGVLPRIAGRIMVYRSEKGDNVLDGLPSLWTDAPETDLLSNKWKQYYAESIWAGPQADWWTFREPYPLEKERPGTWPPDPAWELAPFTMVEKSSSRVVLRSPVSRLTGLELTKTVELLPDGRLVLHVVALNRGEKVVNRDLWLIHRVSPTAKSFLPLNSETPNKSFTGLVRMERVGGLTSVALVTDRKPTSSGEKMKAVPGQGWMATVIPGGFFTVKFDPADDDLVAPGQAPVEVYFAPLPNALCELEHHTALTTLKPGEKMEAEETWQILPYSGPDKAEDEARFLQKNMTASVP